MTIPVSADDAATILGRFPNLPSEAFHTRAVPMLPPDATEEQWLTVRRTGIGASELAAVMGRSPYASPFSVWHAKRGGWDRPPTEEENVGLALEDAVADMWARENDDVYHVCRPRVRLWAHPDYPWLMCSPDRLAMSDQGIWIPVEVKTDEGGKGWSKVLADPAGGETSDVVPFHYRMQLFVQCAIFDAPYGYVARLGRKTTGRKYTTYRVSFDPAEFDEALSAGLAFMHSLWNDDEPDVDGHDATAAALRQMHPLSNDPDDVAIIPDALALQWAAFRKKLSQMKQRSNLLDNMMREAMGGASVAMTADGTRVAKRTVYERAGYTAKPSTVDQLRKVDDDGFAEEGGGLRTPERWDDPVDIPAAPPGDPQTPPGGIAGQLPGENGQG